MVVRPIGDRRRCLHVLAEGREPQVLPLVNLNALAALRGALPASED